ncbi:XrtA/PEP-CTERM system TPR-repeat protein PrsT [Motiliproteus coralliicola]|uniref:XrtA/PEP-CTERM system TPR-repeat protein PrsT n=1 Tax=Motiliproteus coralliicola TaxID=2283196 RepID=UPI0014038422|nr:XrtA/PEP-CTERM system TPR-repeat protein PrsT [Motiliproteus coralliicola]
MFRPFTLTALIVTLGISPLSLAAYTKQDIPDLYEQALIELENGEASSAEIHLKNALQVAPEFLAGHVLLGQTYLDQGRPALAQKQLERGLELGADPALIMEPLANALLAQKKFDLLLDIVYPADFSASLNAKILVYRGRANLELANYNEAELAFRDAARIDVTNLSALLGQARVHLARHSFDQASRIADQALATEPDNAEVWYLLGSIAHAKKQFKTGIEHYGKALSLNPDHYQAKLSRIGVYLDTGLVQEALKDLLELHELAAFDPQVSYLLSVAQRRARLPDQSKESLGKARDTIESLPAEVTSAHGPSLLLSGMIYYDLGEWQKAVTQLDTYAKRYASALSVGKLLGSAYLKLGNLDAAISNLEKAQRTQPKDLQLLLMLGDAYLKKFKHYKASVVYGQALTLSPGNPEAGKGLGLSQIRMGDRGPGLETLRQIYQQSPNATEAGVILAVTLLQDKAYAEAILVAEELLQKSPDNLVLKNLLASAYIAVDKPQQGRELYQAILQQQPDFKPARINLAKLDRVEGKLESARQRLDGLLLDEPQNTLLMLEMARIYDQLKQSDQAVSWLEKAYANNVNDTAVGSYLVRLYLRSGQGDQALELARKLASDNPNDWRATQALALALLDSKELESARGKLKQLSLQSGYDAGQLLTTADLQLRARDISGAIYSLSKAIKAEPGQLATRQRYASLLLQQRRMEEFNEELEYLRQAHPDHPSTLVIEADLLASQRQFEQALEYYRRALTRAPSSSTALKVHRTHLAAGQPQQSLLFLQDWTRRYPQDLRTTEVLAQGYVLSGQYPKAQQLFERLLANGAQTAPIHNNLANLYLKQGDPRALEHAQKAQQLAPNDPSTNDTLGWVLVNQGKLSEGLKYLRDASVRSANNPEVLFHIAATLYQLDRGDEARRALNRAMASGHRFDGYDQALELRGLLADNPPQQERQRFLHINELPQNEKQ